MLSCSTHRDQLRGCPSIAVVIRWGLSSSISEEGQNAGATRNNDFITLSSHAGCCFLCLRRQSYLLFLLQLQAVKKHRLANTQTLNQQYSKCKSVNQHVRKQ